MKALVIASLTVALASGVAMANEAEKVAPAASQTLDADKDGKLSKDEVKADTGLTGKFDALDTNKDGYLDQEELKSARPAAKPAE